MPRGKRVAKPETEPAPLSLVEPCKSLSQVTDVFQKWLVLNDGDLFALEIILATVLANRTRNTDPVWLLVVGPPASAKTEFLRALRGEKDCRFVSRVTPQTLFSGWKGRKSLIYELDGKILIIKEFTTILSMRSEHRMEILSSLREIADGSAYFEFGKGESIPWEGKVGCIGAVTGEIEAQMGAIQKLGQRFIMVRTGKGDRIKIALRAAQNAPMMTMMRAELKEAVSSFFKYLNTHPPEFPTAQAIDDETEMLIAWMADFCAAMRSVVRRDAHTKVLLFVPDAEMPPRLSGQFSLLAKSLAFIRGKGRIDLQEVRAVGRLALGSLPSLRLKVLEVMATKERACGLDTLATEAGLNYATVRELLADLRDLGILKATGDGTNRGLRWTMSEEWSEILRLVLSENFSLDK